MTTLEIIAPTGQSFTAKLYIRGSDAVVETISLVENTNSKGIYKGTVTSNLAGYYRVIVYDNVTPIVVTDVHFDGSSTVFASDIPVTVDSISGSVWSSQSRTITGGTVDTLTNSPSVPSANTIASQVRTELSTELGRIDEKVSAAKVLTSAYDAAKTASQFNPTTDTVARVTLADTVTTLTNSPNVPSAVDIASQVRTNLATELGRIDENVSAAKTLTTETLNSIISSMPDGLTAQQVWEYVTRSLTDKSGFVLSSDYDAAKSAASQSSVSAIPTSNLTAQQVWEYVTRTLTTSAGITAQDVWEYATRSLTDKGDFSLTTSYDLAKTASQFDPATDAVARVTLTDQVTTIPPTDISPITIPLDTLIENLDLMSTDVTSILDKLIFEVPEGPAVTISAPLPNQTAAWTYCYNEHGVPQAGVKIAIKVVSVLKASHNSYLNKTIEAVSNSNGVVSIQIPRTTSLRFAVRRGFGEWVEFSGVDSEYLQLPTILGS